MSRSKIHAAVVTVIAVGAIVGSLSWARADVFSRADADNDGSRAAAVTVALQGEDDFIAVAETRAHRDGEGASATALRVGDTEVGTAPHGEANLLADILDGSPTEAYVDGGCNDTPSAPACVSVLRSTVDEPFTQTAAFEGARVRVGNVWVAVVTSEARGGDCERTANAAIVDTSFGIAVDPASAQHSVFNECG